MLRILVVEDDTVLADLIADGLREHDMIVDVVHDGAAAVSRAVDIAPDVIVLDRDLPVRHGDEVCQILAAEGSSSGLLMLTAAATIEDRVEGLGLGADDYLPKPFDIAELVARIRALARRSRPALPPTLVRGDLRLDCARRVATRAGRLLELSPKELAVLELLLAAQGAVVSAEELLERAWDEAANPFTNTVKMTISRLRAKLGEPPVITTVPQAGYRI
jgi:DNA-binding response OmpR family regulator